MTEKRRFINFLFLLLFGVVLGLLISGLNKPKIKTAIKEPIQEASISAVVSITPTASPSPTVRPLTFSELNKLYGPCVNMPVFMYHHVKDKQQAISEGHGGLTVDTNAFRKHLEYLKNHGYSYVTPAELINFFDGSGNLPNKPVMLTFDDGYSDNYSVAFQIMKEFGAKGVIFIPTGLMNNPGYLSWTNISEMNSSGLITFGNHTWSHMNVGAKKELVQKEIATANTQLSERGLNTSKIFAYPYGLENGYAHTILAEEGYRVAFTTKNGRVLCSKQRLSLPRVRVGDSNLTAYGL